MEIEPSQLCDSSFYGRYWYNISEDGATWSCDNSSFWDVCSDRQYMVFNYSMSNCQSLTIANSGKNCDTTTRGSFCSLLSKCFRLICLSMYIYKIGTMKYVSYILDWKEGVGQHTRGFILFFASAC